MSNRHLAVIDENIPTHEYQKLINGYNKPDSKSKKSNIKVDSDKKELSIQDIINFYRYDKKIKNPEKKKNKVKRMLSNYLLEKYDNLVPEKW